MATPSKNAIAKIEWFRWPVPPPIYRLAHQTECRQVVQAAIISSVIVGDLPVCRTPKLRSGVGFLRGSAAEAAELLLLAERQLGIMPTSKKEPSAWRTGKVEELLAISKDARAELFFNSGLNDIEHAWGVSPCAFKHIGTKAVPDTSTWSAVASIQGQSTWSWH